MVLGPVDDANTIQVEGEEVVIRGDNTETTNLESGSTIDTVGEVAILETAAQLAQVQTLTTAVNTAQAGRNISDIPPNDAYFSAVTALNAYLALINK